MEHANYSEVDEYSKKDQLMPDVILVKKTFPKYRKRQKQRIWKLKHFDKKDEDEVAQQADAEMGSDLDDDEQEAQQNKTKKVSKRGQKKKQRRADRDDMKNNKDYELFLQDLEDDPELRQNVNLYRDDDVIAQLES